MVQLELVDGELVYICGSAIEKLGMTALMSGDGKVQAKLVLAEEYFGKGKRVFPENTITEEPKKEEPKKPSMADLTKLSPKEEPKKEEPEVEEKKGESKETKNRKAWLRKQLKERDVTFGRGVTLEELEAAYEKSKPEDDLLDDDLFKEDEAPDLLEDLEPKKIREFSDPELVDLLKSAFQDETKGITSAMAKALLVEKYELKNVRDLSQPQRGEFLTKLGVKFD